MRLPGSMPGGLIMITGEDDQAIWQPPPAELALRRDEAHVWRARLDQPERLAEFLATLAPDERERADRFRFQKDHDHFITARGVLRALLSRYLHVSPADLSFGYSEHGKPSLAGHHSGDLRFNVSHSHELALFA